MTRLQTALLASLLLFQGVTHAASGGQPFEAYGHYVAVVPAQPTQDPAKVEVLELFWYGCPHCFHFEPYLKDWSAHKPEYVNFIRMPAVFRDSWLPGARAYYTAQLLGVLDKVHGAIFDAMHVRHLPMSTKEEFMDLFASKGVSKEDFAKAWDSFTVQARVRRATMMTREYGITGVPSVIINGKYRASGSSAGSFENLIKVINTLVEQEHAAMPGAAATGSKAP